MNKIITNNVIPFEKELQYLIIIPCVNREERNAIQIIDKTFEGLESSGLFSSKIKFHIMLFESGSNDVSYLQSLQIYKEKYPNKINIIYSKSKLNGNTNTYRMFDYIYKLPNRNQIDFIIWMDDDVFVCKNFIENADAWIKKYANFSLFSSLYVPYKSFPVKKDHPYIHHAKLPGFYGTCCTIFKPVVLQYPLQLWFHKHHEMFQFHPDVRFRESIRKHFFHVQNMCVSYPSLVQHMNIGSSMYRNKDVHKGHTTDNFIGVENDPKLYEHLR